MTPPPPLCPDGHVSSADDYCDVCGTPMQRGAGESAPGAAPGGPGDTAAGGVTAGADEAAATPAQETRVCPHCGAVSSASYLFCEDCGYDFTTGALPRPLAEGLIDTRVRPAPQPAPAAEPAPTGDAAPPTPEPATEPAPDPAPETEAQPEPRPRPATPPTAGPRPTTPPAQAPPPAQTTPPAQATPPAQTTPPAATATGPRPANQAPSRRAAGHWVVEIWIDPGWYEVQESDQACPSPAVPDVVPISGRALVGRYSASRQVVPEVDCGADSGVSRRHAEFTTDGRRWWVEDLGSSNGTFVGPASGPLPTDAIPAGQRVEIDDDERVYVGAWTRLVLRRATASEIAGLG